MLTYDSTVLFSMSAEMSVLDSNGSPEWLKSGKKKKSLNLWGQEELQMFRQNTEFSVSVWSQTLADCRFTLLEIQGDTKQKSIQINP